MYYNLNLTQRERERERTAKKVQNRIPNNRGRINDDQQKYEVEFCVKSSNLCLYIYVTLFMHAFYKSVKKKKKKDDGANISAILEKTSWPKEERGEKVRKK